MSDNASSVESAPCIRELSDALRSAFDKILRREIRLIYIDTEFPRITYRLGERVSTQRPSNANRYFVNVADFS